ncbi:MAG TPA: amidohydrolase family protein [Candidatus Hydrogenedentes bacterium]|nr:amidohydrolase family protein [Candidatus Hydrogenedentota bacterium]HIJ72878.1 amidohydrolase family protein [Candidatus Hydrogenedentota bacterium]
MQTTREIRALALDSPRIDTHLHYPGEIPDLRDLVNTFGAFTETPNMIESRVNAIGCKMLYGIDPGLFLRPDAPEALFGTAADVAAVQHYAFRHALAACIRNELPVVIHTGFQIWGHADLRQSNPMHVHNLLIDKRYKDLTFVLLHGGNPYVGETTYLARMFPNVIIDFTWIAWMTRGRFRAALAEWLEIVPHGKFCWGSDSNFPEDVVGKGQITREEIANVLEDLIARRIIDEPTAIDFLEHTYQKTPKRIFDL